LGVKKWVIKWVIKPGKNPTSGRTGKWIRLDKEGQIAYYEFFNKSKDFQGSGQPRALAVREGCGTGNAVRDSKLSSLNSWFFAF
jgi:hypothetical protein